MYIGEEYDIANKDRQYWEKFDKHTLNKVLENIGVARDASINVKDKEAKKSVLK